MKAMILAAGQGKRLRPLTLTCPKPLIKVDNKELLAYHLEKLKQANITDIIINSAYLSEQIVDFVNNYADKDMHLSNSIEDGLGLETAGGIIKALDFFDDEPFLVINADIFLDCDYGLFAQHQLQSKYYAHLFLVKNPQHNLKGDFAIAEDGHLITGNAYTFSGVGIYTKQAFFNLAVQRLALRPIFDKLINLNKVSAKYIDIPWFDVGSIDRLETLNNFLKNKN